jgi:ATP-dependent helicase/nuclease subunit B
MATIVQQSMTRADPWQAITESMIAWTQASGVDQRDAVMLVPFAQHLPLARSAWASAGGWMPRIETTQTLARSLGPDAPQVEGQISFDVASDSLTAAALLQAQARAWAQEDARGFAHAVAALVRTAHDFARACVAVPPQQRGAYWQACRDALPAGHGPGSSERLLARVALEWAALGPAPVSDALFGLRPAAWLVVQAGGVDALTAALLREAEGTVPCHVQNLDAQITQPFLNLVGDASAIEFAVCESFEAEAQRSAAQVLSYLNQNMAPVALIAQDRLLVRRVRALLSRQGVPIQDETGWKLSTTRAGAAVMGLLRLTRPDASLDECLDWLKATAMATSPVLQALEAGLRRHAWRQVDNVDVTRLPPGAARLWQQLQALQVQLAAFPRQSLPAWLASADQALRAFGTRGWLEADEAGRQVLSALQLDRTAFPPGNGPLSLPEFTAWVDRVLEQASFIPEAPPHPLVIVTPLARATLRPFAAVVFPGTDERHLGTAD